MNKKRIKIAFSILALAFLLTGCASSSDIISLDTTFQEVSNGGFFAGVITWPLAQLINLMTPHVGIFFAIALVTILLNGVVLVLTFKSSVSMQRIQEIQPEMQKIQAKYEGRNDDMSQQRMAMEMNQLYKKYDINPFTSLLTTFIQFPLLIGMYNAIRRSDAVANATFLGATLSQTPKVALAGRVWVCVVIFLAMIFFQFISIKIPQWLAEYHGKKEAEKHHKSYKKAENPNQMMTYGMLAMIALAMYSCPTGLSLYYCIYSIVNILKTLVIDKMTHKEN